MAGQWSVCKKLLFCTKLATKQQRDKRLVGLEYLLCTTQMTKIGTGGWGILIGTGMTIFI